MSIEAPNPPDRIASLFASADDCHVIVGTCYAGEPPLRLGIVRIVLYSDAPLKPWPEKLVVRKGTEIMPDEREDAHMFLLAPPGELARPYAAVEWVDSCDDFVHAVEKNGGVYLVEFYQPSKLSRALVTGEAVDGWPTVAITPDEFKQIAEGMDLVYPPPTTPPPASVS